MTATVQTVQVIDVFGGDIDTWALLLGVLSPLAIAVIQQPRWSPVARWFVGWLCALIIGAVTCLASGVLDQPSTVLRVCVLVLVAAQAAYVGWQKSGVVPAIERATSPSAIRPPDRFA